MSPKSAEPTSIAPTYRTSQRRTDPRNVELSLTSSCQTKAKSPSEAGQYPSHGGYLVTPRAGSPPVTRASSRLTVRIGLIARKIGPNSNENGTIPTQSST